MTRMTDPSDALKSFQEAFSRRELELQRCELDQELFVHLDHPAGTPRFTYVTLEKGIVTALVMFVVIEPIEQIPCFQIGYAVPKAHRNQGRAKRLIEAAILEMKNGFSRAKIEIFYIEAVVSKDNIASMHVAEAAISKDSKEVTDEFSGSPAFRYLRKIG